MGEQAKTSIIAHYDRVALVFDRLGPAIFQSAGRRLVDLADIRAGERVLDVAAGRGAVLLAAAERVGPTGRAVGIDLSRRMVSQTRSEIARRRLRHLQMRVMDAEAMTFADHSFDVLTCGFGLMFFPNLERALRGFRRVLRDPGRLAVSTWGIGDSAPWIDELMAAYGLTWASLRIHSLNTPEQVEHALAGSGFRLSRVLQEEMEIVYRNEEEWWARIMATGGGEALRGLDPARLPRFKAEALAGLQSRRRPDGFHEVRRADLRGGHPGITMTELSLQERFAPRDRCFGCGQANPKGLRLRSHVAGDELVAEWQPESHHQAVQGVLNGGIIGTLFDCHSNWTAAWHFMRRSGADRPPVTVTAEYSVRLVRPTLADAPVRLTGRVVESTDDRAVVEAELSAGGTVCATFRGTFVAVKPGHPAYQRW